MPKLTTAEMKRLEKNLGVGEYATAEDMVLLKKLIDYEVNERRQQKYSITKEIPKKFNQFDTAKFINNLLGALRKLNKNKFSLVTQNVTFIRALYDIFKKVEKLTKYAYQKKYDDHAGCDGECRGLCSSCTGCCVGGATAAAGTGGSGGSSGTDAGGACTTWCTTTFTCGAAVGCPGYCSSYVANGNVFVGPGDGSSTDTGANYCPSNDWGAGNGDCAATYTK